MVDEGRPLVEGGREGEERKVEESGPAARGVCASVKAFLTKGSARWGVLVGVGLLVGVACVVYKNPRDIGTGLRQMEKLRGKLLLHNQLQAGAATQAMRRALSGTDPVHRERDDVKDLKSALKPEDLASVSVHNAGTGDSVAQFLSATSRSIHEAHAVVKGTAASCASQCDANGYAAAVAGTTAAQACVDVCLEEHGAKAQAPARRARSAPAPASDSQSGGSDQEAAQRLLDQVRAQAPGSPAPAFPAGKLPGDLAGIVVGFGVQSASLPKAEQAKLKTALAMDETIAIREAKDRRQLKNSWDVAVKQMRTLDAARLDNAKSLAKATTRAVSENKAIESLDASVLSAAAQFEHNLGSAVKGSKLPVNAPKAEKQLESARAVQRRVEQAARLAGEILSDEGMKWKNGNELVQRQLNAPNFVDPGSDIEAKMWADVLKDAAYMPKADAGKVRLAAMSDGKLLAMQRDNYAQLRKRMKYLAEDVRESQAARAANAKILAHRTSKMAIQKRADSKLLAAEANYVSTVSKIGGKSKVATSASDLSSKILKDSQQARALQLVGQAGAMMAGRYGSVVKDTDSAATGITGIGADRSAASLTASASGVASAPESWFSPTRTARLGHEEHKKQRGKGKLSGAQAVAAAAKGWFSPYSAISPY